MYELIKIEENIDQHKIYLHFKLFNIDKTNLYSYKFRASAINLFDLHLRHTCYYSMLFHLVEILNCGDLYLASKKNILSSICKYKQNFLNIPDWNGFCSISPSAGSQAVYYQILVMTSLFEIINYITFAPF